MYLYSHYSDAQGSAIVFSMPTILSFANQKGGPGKSSAGINVASALADAGYRIHVLDADNENATFRKWYKRRVATGRNGFHVEPITSAEFEAEIERLRANQNLDLVVVDCPGNVPEMFNNAVAVSDAIICPIRPTFSDTDAARDMVKRLKRSMVLNPKIRLLLFVSQTVKSWGIAKSAQSTLRDDIFAGMDNVTVLATEIPISVAVASFNGTGLSIFEYDPKSQAARAYKKLTKEVIACLSQTV